MDFGKLEFLYEVNLVRTSKPTVIQVSKYKVTSIPAIDLFVDIENDQIIDVAIDDDCNDEVDYSLLHWWSDWCGDETGHDDVPVIGLYALKDFPNIEVYIDVENERVVEAWIVDDEI